MVVAKDMAFAEAKSIPDQPVPIHLRDAHFYGADKLGHGRGYKYPHDYPGHYVKQQYLPDGIKDRVYYEYGNNKTENAAHEYHKKLTGKG